MDKMRMDQPWVPVGIVRKVEPLVIETRNVLETGDSIEYMGKNLQTVACIVTAMTLKNGAVLERANPGNRVIITTEPVIFEPECNSISGKKYSDYKQNSAALTEEL